MKWRILAGVGLAGALLSSSVSPAGAQTPAGDVAALGQQVNLLWVVIGAVLVIFMQAGFALVETGFCRAKHAAHVVSTDLAIFGLGFVAFLLVGYAFMFGGCSYVLPGADYGYKAAVGGPLLKLGDWVFLWKGGLALTGIGSAGGAAVMGFLYMTAFMDTTATIPTGSMAERWKWRSFVGGACSAAPSTTRCSAPGPGPAAPHREVRAGRHAPGPARPQHPRGHAGHVHPASRLMLAGLVAITAVAFVDPWAAAVIGVIAGVLVIESSFFVERRLHIDDPVGAISVHGVCGNFGVLAVGIFSNGHYGAGWNLTEGVDGGVTGILYGGSGAEQLVALALGQFQQGRRWVGVDQAGGDGDVADAELLEVQRRRLAVHADVGDVAAGPDEPGGQLEALGHSDRLDGDVGTEPTGSARRGRRRRPLARS
jgi:Ammonium Transporter Family